MIKSLEEGTLL